LLDDVDPHAGRVEEAEAPLAEGLVPERQGDRRTLAREALVLGPRVLDPLKRSGPGGADGCPGCMNARLAGPDSPALSRTNQVASNTTSRPNQRR